MGQKTLKRALYGGLAVVFFVFAGRELMAGGATLEALVAGGAGLFLTVSAFTGAG